MTGSDASDRSHPDWWDARYLGGDTPWDTGIVPPEVIALVDSPVVSRGWALDLGCGSGVTSCFLATHGFRVVGVDLSQVALRRASARAAASGLPCLFVRASVDCLSFVRMQATLAIDIGCFHNLTPSGRTSYIRTLGELLRPGAHYLLYTFFAPESASGTSDPSTAYVVGPADMAAFAPYFTLLSAAHGQDRERPSAWFHMRRSDGDLAAPS